MYRWWANNNETLKRYLFWWKTSNPYSHTITQHDLYFPQKTKLFPPTISEYLIISCWHWCTRSNLSMNKYFYLSFDEAGCCVRRCAAIRSFEAALPFRQLSGQLWEKTSTQVKRNNRQRRDCHGGNRQTGHFCNFSMKWKKPTFKEGKKTSLRKDTGRNYHKIQNIIIHHIKRIKIRI